MHTKVWELLPYGIHTMQVWMERIKNRLSNSCLHNSAVKCYRTYKPFAVVLEMKDDPILQTRAYVLTMKNTWDSGLSSYFGVNRIRTLAAMWEVGKKQVELKMDIYVFLGEILPCMARMPSSSWYWNARGDMEEAGRELR